MNCDRHIGSGMICFDRVIAAGDMLAVEKVPPGFCFDGIWIPKILMLWPQGTAHPGPQPCTIHQIWIDGHRQIPVPWPISPSMDQWRQMTVGWDAVDSRRGMQFIVRAADKAVRFVADLLCELYSRKHEGT